MKAKLIQGMVDLVLLPLIGLAIFLLAWGGVSALTYDAKQGRSDLPSPIQTLRESSKYLQQPFSHNEEENFDGLGLLAMQSLVLVSQGYLLAIAVAVPLGFLLGSSQTFAKCFDPIFQLLRPVSPLAWYPLAGLITLSLRKQVTGIDATTWQCVITIGICALWPTAVNTAMGVRAIPQDYLNVAKVLRLGRFGTFAKVLLPATLPYMFTGFRLSLGIAWLVIVAAEMLSGKAGIGSFVDSSYQAADYGSMLMSILVIGLVGFVLDRLMSLVERNIHTILSLPAIVRRAIESIRARRLSGHERTVACGAA
jgi:nitrate/nitrite transport system permease protein